MTLGTSVGWADVYPSTYPDNWIDVTGLRGCFAVVHRVGRCEVGEVSVAIAVSAPHRHDALAACKDAIDELKETAPLWKKEVYEGGEEWIGRGS